MISAFGFNDLAVMRIFVLLNLTGFAITLGLNDGWNASGGSLRVKDRDDVSQAVAAYTEGSYGSLAAIRDRPLTTH